MIKYIGSKRALVPVLGNLLARSGARTVLDLFTGTTRVAQEFKRRGAFVIAVDSARYSEIFSRCHVETDARSVDRKELGEAIRYLQSLPGEPGYFTEVFCVRSRFFQPFNGERIDAIRNAIERDFRGTRLWPLLMASLIYAADRVDSTTGVQMAYLKQWSARSFKPLELREPRLYPGSGKAVRADALQVVGRLPEVDLAYLDPPYNQHRYFTNYHVWETLVAWDDPPWYGVACKRSDSREEHTRSVFNSKRRMPVALQRVVEMVRAGIVVLSYNDESWIGIDELVAMCSSRGHVEVLAFDSRRYVGAQIGIYSPSGEKVGRVSRLRNVEYLLLAGDRDRVVRMAAPYRHEGIAKECNS